MTIERPSLRRNALLACVVLAAAGLAGAPVVPASPQAQPRVPAGQSSTPGAEMPATAAGTGDPWLDAYRDDIDTYGRQYRAAFVDELVRYYAAPRAMAVELLDNGGWRPGDLYLACAISQRRGRPCRHAVERFDPSVGWAPLLESQDMAAGSPDLHRIKRALVATYRRWARPILLDAGLQADFPDLARDPGNRFVAPDATAEAAVDGTH
ncbi:hypothetical protein [Lysobacter sp. A3-1-A15]|uniref:hypothetical protein n=1 Tax=Novilysobacter viscosus TaxID=3098602 RepID=UPI002ED90ED0